MHVFGVQMLLLACTCTGHCATSRVFRALGCVQVGLRLGHPLGLGCALVEERLERDEEGVRALWQELAVQRVPRVRADLEHDLRTLWDAREGAVGL